MDIKDKINSLRKELHEDNYQYYVLDNPDISDYEFDLKLKQLEELEKANKKELENLKNNDPKFNVNINESWFIRYNKGGFILPHAHGNCSWCCVYYVQIGKDASKKNGSTFFLRPYLTNSLKEEFGGKYLKNDTAVFNAEEGKLLVWPNFLQHGSHPYQGNEDRIIISANSTIDLL